MDRKLIMLMGIPGSGKSTVAARIAKQEYGYVVSSDQTRKELFGDESVQGDPAKVFALVHKKIFALLDEEFTVVYDATNINAKKRMAFVNAVRAKYEDDVECICVCVLCHPEVAIERDKARSRTVGAKVIEKMVRGFQAPGYNEGWDLIKYEWTSDMLYDMSNVLRVARDFNQKNPHHTATLGEHMAKAAHHAKDTNLVEMAAAYHDIGKLFTQVFGDDGVAHYYDHASVGAYVYLCSNRAFETADNFGKPGIVTEISSLICWHMIPYQYRTKGEFFHWTAKRRMPTNFANDLWELHEADLAAH